MNQIREKRKSRARFQYSQRLGCSGGVEGGIDVRSGHSHGGICRLGSPYRNGQAAASLEDAPANTPGVPFRARFSLGSRRLFLLLIIVGLMNAGLERHIHVIGDE